MSEKTRKNMALALAALMLTIAIWPGSAEPAQVEDVADSDGKDSARTGDTAANAPIDGTGQRPIGTYVACYGLGVHWGSDMVFDNELGRTMPGYQFAVRTTKPLPADGEITLADVEELFRLHVEEYHNSNFRGAVACFRGKSPNKVRVAVSRASRQAVSAEKAIREGRHDVKVNRCNHTDWMFL